MRSLIHKVINFIILSTIHWVAKASVTMTHESQLVEMLQRIGKKTKNANPIPSYSEAIELASSMIVTLERIYNLKTLFKLYNVVIVLKLGSIANFFTRFILIGQELSLG